MEIEPSPAHQAFMNDLRDALKKNVNLTGMEMLAVASQFVGMLIAFQDATRCTSEQVMAMVINNVERGNQVAVESSGLFDPRGTA